LYKGRRQSLAHSREWIAKKRSRGEWYCASIRHLLGDGNAEGKKGGGQNGYARCPSQNFKTDTKKKFGEWWG